MNFFIRFITRRNQSARMKLLKEQQRLSRAESRSTKFTVPQQQAFRKPIEEKQKDTSAALKRFLHKDGLSLLGIVVILLGGAYVITFRSPYLILSNITVNDTQFVSKTEVQDGLMSILQHRTFGIPRDRYVTTSQQRLEQELQKKFKQNFAVADITVQKKYPNSVEVVVTERIPSITWITKDGAGIEHFYTVDHDGKVTKETVKKAETDPKLPQISDKNRPQLWMNWQIIGTTYIDSVIALQKKLTDTGWGVQSFIFPPMACEQQEYVTQQIFADEIKDSISEKFKEKKRTVQEQFKKGDLGLEESLQALEDIKKEEAAERDGALSVNTSSAPRKLEWATVDKEVPCDYVQVATDLHVLATKGSEKTIELKFDTSRNLDEQLTQLQTVVTQGKVNTNEIQSIDLRIADRVYYK